MTPSRPNDTGGLRCRSLITFSVAVARHSPAAVGAKRIVKSVSSPGSSLAAGCATTMYCAASGPPRLTASGPRVSGPAPVLATVKVTLLPDASVIMTVPNDAVGSPVSRSPPGPLSPSCGATPMPEMRNRYGDSSVLSSLTVASSLSSRT